MCKNPFWKELYSSLITCRLNILQDFPEEYRYITINSKPLQSWSVSKNLGEILESNGNFGELNEISGDRKPLIYEYDEIKRTLTHFVEIYFGGRLGANSCRSARSNECGRGYNIYGRLVTK